MYTLFLKRLIDILSSIFLLVFLSPVFVLIAIFLSLINGGNPFFIQKRPGLNGKLFRLVKFKTMNDLRDSQWNLLPDEQRLKGFGKFIRKSSLDEIPQLWNVLIGEMSLVGPRPLLMEYLPLYNSYQSQRHLVKPGITGLAQVNGRNSLTWEKKFEYDIYYVKNVSFKMDFLVIMKTVQRIFKPEGINQIGHVTMPKFEGSKKS